MEVKYSYLQKQFANPDKILNDMREQLTRCQFTLGPEVEQFESSFAKLIGTKYAIGVNSGTDALFLSLKAAGVGYGDEVITATNTFIATAGAIVAAGAKPVFVDCNADYNIEISQIEKAITKKTKAIMPVHYAGSPAEIKEVLRIAKKHKLPVVEDACQAISAALDGQNVGTFGIAAGFSLHPLKNLNVWGDGGMVVTNSKEIRDKIILLRNHGLANRDEVHIFGYNSRLDTIQAIVGNYLIGQAEDITRKRIRNADKYDAALSGLKSFVTLPPRRKNTRHVYHIYIFEAKNRDALLAHLINSGIEAKIHYPMPLHLQKASKIFGYKKGDFPAAEKQAKNIISLPVHQHLSDEQVNYVIEKIREFYA